jgi:ureidoacrylate peracid hydrolase
MDVFSSHRKASGGLVIRPETAAVLIVDMLADFCLPGGKMVLPGYEALIGPQNAVIEALRQAGGTVIYVVDAHRPQMRRDREFLKRTPHCIEGTDGVRIVPELDQQPGDITVLKRRFSGFFNTDLDLTLRDMMVDTVIVMGVVTNICVRSTVHDAFFHGYSVIVPKDCCAATGPREQESSLYDISTHFGIVSDAQGVVASITTGATLTEYQIDG